MESDNEMETEMDPLVSSETGLVSSLKHKRPLTDSEKYYLLNNHFVSAKEHQFASSVFGSKQTRFQASWLDGVSLT